MYYLLYRFNRCIAPIVSILACSIIYCQFVLRLCNVKLSSLIQIDFGARFFTPRGGKIFLGKNIIINSNQYSNYVSKGNVSMLASYGPGSVIRIGDFTGLSSCTICCINSINIGANCLIGADCLIVDNDFHAGPRFNPHGDDYLFSLSSSMPVSIGDNCFLGARAIILKGVTLGHNCIIGAGSVVTKSFPPHSIVAGNPASLIGRLRE